MSNERLRDMRIMNIDVAVVPVVVGAGSGLQTRPGPARSAWLVDGVV